MAMATPNTTATATSIQQQQQTAITIQQQQQPPYNSNSNLHTTATATATSIQQQQQPPYNSNSNFHTTATATSIQLQQQQRQQQAREYSQAYRHGRGLSEQPLTGSPSDRPAPGRSPIPIVSRGPETTGNKKGMPVEFTMLDKRQEKMDRWTAWHCQQVAMRACAL